ncbi:MAG: hypothetical protein R3316_11520 [Rhodovibrionaceae bacterium]|nr:hypothetical protein [Rhodovibrionaceae bacterium]
MPTVLREDYETARRLLVSPVYLSAGERVLLNLVESSYLSGEALTDADLFWARAIAARLDRGSLCPHD